MYTILNINIDDSVLEFPANDELIRLAVGQSNNNKDNKQSISNDNGQTLSYGKDTAEYIDSLIQLNHFIKRYYTFFNYAKLYDNAKQNNEESVTDKFKNIALANKPRLADVGDKYIKNDLILDLFKQQSAKVK
ncbi:hypothetical protein DY120_01810 [Apilactobacillus micheneri]|uniref:Uncharacterized protein n=1 Tax=Apilactobacillus micheneri TaxID=1899430 RepID=A0ABY2YZT1_9LACO|nr:hypothetical protein [Apilactobacillus micheneri]TPR26455.1 hypothetical protein DY114_01810 [Apilactobacillus micheneri]TPR27209.1 hypothetical protein DY111_01810 [Apilactobacillus micheneri]TPR27456.1 hypothetical protein DY113_06760 [Apilactobacillus micheneri]TPR31972.1 hypothetical protein DY117_01810 [Apilactobacillus micheneri]TPR32376.1 hypothetical protein DY120_01810 [Apilactobacillus micheneri]